MLLPANINSLHRRLPVLADRTLWREDAALDRADHHGIDARAWPATVVAGWLPLTQSAGLPQWQSEFILPWIPRFGITIHGD